MHSRHSKCFWNRYNATWPLWRQQEECLSGLTTAECSVMGSSAKIRPNTLSQHVQVSWKWCECIGRGRRGRWARRPLHTHRGWIGHIFWKVRDTKEYNKYLQTVYLQCTKCVNDRESLKPYYTPPSTAVNMELRCLPFCHHYLLFGFEKKKHFLGARVNKLIIRRRWNCTNFEENGKTVFSF